MAALQSDWTGDLVLQAGRDLHLENAIRARQRRRQPGPRTGDILRADRRTGNIAVTTARATLTLRKRIGSILLRRGGVFNNLRLASDGGDLTLAAGTRSAPRPPAVGPGSGSAAPPAPGAVAQRWRSSYRRLGSGGNTFFAEVTVPGFGSILSTQALISVETNAVSGSQGRIAAVNGASLDPGAAPRPGTAWSARGSGRWRAGRVVGRDHRGFDAGLQPDAGRDFSRSPAAGRRALV